MNRSPVSFGVIFDMDGVLVDSAPPHLQSWKALADELGSPITDEQFYATFGRQNRDCLAVLFGITDAESVSRLSDRKEEIYRAIIRQRVPAMDGAIELVRACHAAGLRVAVGTSGPAANVAVCLDGMGIAECFHARITAEQVTRGKPDPQVFRLAAEAIEIPPARCAVIEDAPAGIEAALAADTTAIALAGTHPASSLSRAHLTVASLRELSPRRIVDAIETRANE